MREVSGKVIDFFEANLASRGIAAERLTAGLPLDREALRARDSRYDWHVHVQLLERMEELAGGVDALEQMGMEAVEDKHLSAVRALAGYLVGPSQVYMMIFRWTAPSLFRHIRYDFKELGDGASRVTIEIPEGYAAPRAFFVMNKGFMRQVPAMLGLRGTSRVDLEVDGQRAEYTIHAPRRRSLLGAVSRILGFRTAASQAVEELVRQQHDLQQVEALLGEQSGQLETLDALGQSLAAQIESEHLGDGLLEALRGRFGWRGAALSVASPEDAAPRLVSTSGDLSGRPQAHALTAGGRLVGRLQVWGPDRTADPLRGELLGKMLPWIAMAVANAKLDAGQEGPERFRWAGGEGERELFLIVDSEGRVRYAGPTVEGILGIDQEEALQLDIAALVHPDDLKTLRASFMSFGEGPGSSNFSDARLRRGDGSWRVLEGVGIKVRDERGQPVFMFSASDVTDRRRTH